MLLCTDERYGRRGSLLRRHLINAQRCNGASQHGMPDPDEFHGSTCLVDGSGTGVERRRG